MGAPTTYAELKTSLAAWLNRSDLTSMLDEFIGYAEARFNHSLFVPEREYAATITASTAYNSLPSDLWELRAAFIDGTPRYALEQISLADLRSRYDTTAATPIRRYAISDGRIYWGPTPASPTTVSLSYYQTIPALSGSNASNWLLAKRPSLYLRAALAEAELYLANPETAQLHDSIVQREMAELMDAGNRKRYGGGPLIARGSITPSLRGVRA